MATIGSSSVGKNQEKDEDVVVSVVSVVAAVTVVVRFCLHELVEQGRWLSCMSGDRMLGI